MELKDKNGEVIVADTLKTPPYSSSSILLGYYNTHGYNNVYKGFFKENSEKILSPFFINNSKQRTELVLEFSTKQMVDLKNIAKIKDISIELEEK